jgi:hypothetical protein
MPQKFSRRAIIKGTLMAGACTPTFALLNDAFAQALMPLTDTNPTAKALGFVSDSSQVDSAKFPGHTAAQTCSSCAQYTGQSGDARGGCKLFVGYTVPAGGWCTAWAKSGTS